MTGHALHMHMMAHLRTSVRERERESSRASIMYVYATINGPIFCPLQESITAAGVSPKLLLSAEPRFFFEVS